MTPEQEAKAREAFEIWAKQQGSDGYDLTPLMVDGRFFHYRHSRTLDAWEGWKGCEQAAWSAAQAQQSLVPDLAMLVRRLSHALSGTGLEYPRRAAESAMGFLIRHGLQGSPLRDATPPKEPPPEAVYIADKTLPEEAIIALTIGNARPEDYGMVRVVSEQPISGDGE
jgi:hypothetical protein